MVYLPVRHSHAIHRPFRKLFDARNEVLPCSAGCHGVPKPRAERHLFTHTSTPFTEPATDDVLGYSYALILFVVALLCMAQRDSLRLAC